MKPEDTCIKHPNHSILFIPILLISLFLLGCLGIPAEKDGKLIAGELGQAPSAEIKVVPPETVGYNPGDTFEIEIWVYDVEDLFGYEFKLNYDSSIINVSSYEIDEVWPVGLYLGFGPGDWPNEDPTDYDIDSDGDIDVADLAYVSKWFGACDGGLPPGVDVNGDGCVDIRDIMLFPENYSRYVEDLTNPDGVAILNSNDFVVVSSAIAPSTGITGDIKLATITFEVKGRGQTDISFYDTLPVDSHSVEISHGVQDGSFDNTIPTRRTLHVPAIEKGSWETWIQTQNMGTDNTGVIFFGWGNYSGSDEGPVAHYCQLIKEDAVWTLRDQIAESVKSGIFYTVRKDVFGEACGTAGWAEGNTTRWKCWVQEWEDGGCADLTWGDPAGAKGEEIAAEVVRKSPCNSSTYPALPERWLGLELPHEYYLPVVYKEYNNLNSNIIIQNAGTENASVWLNYTNGSGMVVHTQYIEPITPGEAFRVNLPDVSGLPSEWFGSAVVGSNVPLAIVVDRSSELSSYVGLSSAVASKTSYALFDHRRKNSDTVVWVQNPSGAEAGVNVSFFDASANLLQTASHTIPAGASYGFEMTAENRLGFWVGAIKVESDRPVLSVVEIDAICEVYDLLTISDKSLSWNAFPALPAEYIALPLAAREEGDWGLTTTFVIGNMNPNPGYTNVTAYFRDETGGTLCMLPIQLGPGQVVSFNLNNFGCLYPGYIGAARLTAVSTQDGGPSLITAYTSEYPEACECGGMGAGPASTHEGTTAHGEMGWGWEWISGDNSVAYEGISDVTDDSLGPSLAVVPKATQGRRIAIPRIDHGDVFGTGDWDTKIYMQNAGDLPTMAAIISWGEYSEQCPPNAPGPVNVACTPEILSGASYKHDSISDGEYSAIVYSLPVEVADGICEELENCIGDSDLWRQFDWAYREEATWGIYDFSQYEYEDLAVAVERKGPNAYGTAVISDYEGISEYMEGLDGPYEYYAPYVLKGYNGLDTEMTIQNLGQYCTSVWIHYQEQGSCTTVYSQHIEQLAPGEAIRVKVPAQIPCFWLGSAEISAEQPLGMTVDEASFDEPWIGIDRGELLTYRAFPKTSPAATELWAPLYYREWFGWDASVHVQCLSQTGQQTFVTVEFLDEEGDIVLVLGDWVCPTGSTTFYMPIVGDIGDDVIAGAVRIRSVDQINFPGGMTPSQPIAAFVSMERPDNPINPEINAQGIAINAWPMHEFVDAPHKIFLPGLEREYNQITEITITDFNPVLSDTTDITIDFYAEDGSIIHSMPLTLDDMVTKLNLLEIRELPVNYNGSAVITVEGSAVGAVASRRALVDIAPPTIKDVTISPNPALNTAPSYTVKANVTDNIAVDAVWVTISTTNSSMAYNPSTDLYENSTVPSLPIGKYAVNVTANDTAGNTAYDDSVILTVYAEGPPPRKKMDINLSPGPPFCQNIILTINITEEDHLDKPVKGADLRIFTPSGGRIRGKTNDEGIYKLATDEEGEYEIRASKSGYDPAKEYATIRVCEKAPEVECERDEQCNEDEKCINNECVLIDCPAGYYIQNRECVKYECMEDDDCLSTEKCIDHTCIPVTGECGYVENHTWFNYTCCEDEDCEENETCINHSCVLKEVPPEVPPEEAASDAMEDAQDAIKQALSAGMDVAEAQERLQQAQAAFDRGDFDSAEQLAQEAMELLAAAKAPPTPPEEVEEEIVPEVPEAADLLPIIGAIIIIAFVIGGVWLFLKKKKGEVKPSD